jgi:hypothetical protein
MTWLGALAFYGLGLPLAYCLVHEWAEKNCTGTVGWRKSAVIFAWPVLAVAIAVELSLGRRP